MYRARRVAEAILLYFTASLPECGHKLPWAHRICFLRLFFVTVAYFVKKLPGVDFILFNAETTKGFVRKRTVCYLTHLR
ncbi:hypothetical protein Cst_c06010 [Thermoclostridium stercorarium subsp. stercorarium DSM 8532]|uniref:Uncharacterized protein n=3 Tax=Thermoclostridium stercorarium TaxID=1510 RepID=L7VPZ3_THES1|nr:hypothetical protein Cst_c06010 [Thermoclostridium stercorarium subsp. stercorarium DSM 8532]ANW98041.1 hypothetical protein CSTERTH_02775 [Thermoclostridium stercorarium subsp. thermolacticum DSM 2910]ANX00588.1 hypothetical protein CSTERLE_02765 [Thermoclostridium stercorarium subsp. leptospartum DSM 9219]